jgi:hypothetical protein
MRLTWEWGDAEITIIMIILAMANDRRPMIPILYSLVALSSEECKTHKAHGRVWAAREREQMRFKLVSS